MNHGAMRLFFVVAAASVLFAASALAQTGDQPGKLTSLVGTWERSHDGDPQIKIYSDTHYMWAVYDAETGKTKSSGGGTYKFDGKTLVENVIFSTISELNGKQQTLNVESPEADSFRLWGKAANSHEIDETFTRAKP